MWPDEQIVQLLADGPIGLQVPSEPFLELNDLINGVNDNGMVDLNFPPPEDLGEMNQLLPDAAAVGNQEPGENLEQVIVADELPDVVVLPHPLLFIIMPWTFFCSYW